jgi:ribosomal RNA-processing protein 1
MAREWTNIDVLRMEKFLLLTRRYLGASLEVLKKSNWDKTQVKAMIELWEEIPFNVTDVKVPNGMRFHCIDILVDELERVGALSSEGENGDENGEVPLEVLLGPLRGLASGSPVKAVRVKARGALEDERLGGNEKVEEEKDGEEGDGEDEWGGIEE